ncbi:MAG: arsenite methyltransferase [Anaerolineae bacterium]|nr:arsenite methyltransferase [Anaerolineae bacterium]
MENETIKKQVQERYAHIARQQLAGAPASCCTADVVNCCGTNVMIPADEITARGALPTEVVNTSLGCGTPLEIAQLQPGETVLDLGSGGGLDCLLAAKRVGAHGRVIGVDMTPEMIALARANAHKVGATNVEFRQGELEHLPLDDASVDVIISNCVVNLAPDKVRVFREAFRVLKPDGRIAVSDMVARAPLPDSLRTDMAVWAACIGGAITEHEYIEAMRAAGFVEVQKVSGGEDSAAMVYSAKFIARKPDPRAVSGMS